MFHGSQQKWHIYHIPSMYLQTNLNMIYQGNFRANMWWSWQLCISLINSSWNVKMYIWFTHMKHELVEWSDGSWAIYRKIRKCFKYLIISTTCCLFWIPMNRYYCNLPLSICIIELFYVDEKTISIPLYKMMKSPWFTLAHSILLCPTTIWQTKQFWYKETSAKLFKWLMRNYFSIAIYVTQLNCTTNNIHGTKDTIPQAFTFLKMGDWRCKDCVD